MIFGSVADGLSGLALPVEGRQWMISATGIADRRPPRDPAGFVRFLSALRDPAVADLVSGLQPVSDVAVHRQTSNRRYPWGCRSGWPVGLLVVGDALCSLDPVYGQGITVAAIQAGCDGLLVCSGNVDLQAGTLEALVRAVERGDIPAARLDDAERRLRRAKERFLTSRQPPGVRRRTWRQVVGCDAHRAVADEMAAFL